MKIKAAAVLGLVIILFQLLLPSGYLAAQITEKVPANEPSQGSKITGLLAAQVATKQQARILGGLSQATESASMKGQTSILQAPGLRTQDIGRQQVFLYFSQMPGATQRAELEALGVFFMSTLGSRQWALIPTGF